MRHRFSWFVAATVFVLIAGDALFWDLAANKLRAGVEDWISARRAQGWVITGEPLSVSGWPFYAQIAIPGLALRHAGSDIPGDVDLRLSDITLSFALFRPVSMRGSMKGPQRVRVGNAQEITVTGSPLKFGVPLGASPARPVSLFATNLQVAGGTGSWQATVDHLTGEAGPAASEANEPQAVAFSLNASTIDLPKTVRWPLGAQISSFEVSGKLNGPLPALPSMTGWAAAWRDGGGSLDVQHLGINWGSLDLAASATLALDDQLQPMGTGSAKVTGYADTLDRLAAASLLTKSAATVAKAVLSLLAGTGDGDTPPSVDVPLTLQYRTLSMRQVPLTRFPELDWPQP